MRIEEMLFCKLMEYSLHTNNKKIISSSYQEEILASLPKLIDIANLHNMLPALYDTLCKMNVTLSSEDELYFRQAVTSTCYGCYDMLNFTKEVIQILSKLSIRFFVLKGVTLLSSYPKFEYRRYGDVDIYIPDKTDFETAKQHLFSLGFIPKKDLVDHHIELLYQKNTTTYLLELHSKVIATQGNKVFNKQLESIYRDCSPISETFTEINLTYPMLSHTENCLYLLLHMLQHFMSAGFGIKLLYDWTAYLEKNINAIDIPHLNNYLQILGLTGFCDAVTLLCKKYFGLSSQICSDITTNTISEKVLSEFMKDIVSAGEFGKTDSARLLIMQNSGRYSQYLHEFHRQMKNRFQKAHKIILFWPFLWLVTGICFVWNNRFLRKTKTSTLLATTKKRQKLLRDFKLFYQRK